MTVMPARFRGKCPACDQWYERGWPVKWGRRGLLIHAECEVEEP